MSAITEDLSRNTARHRALTLANIREDFGLWRTKTHDPLTGKTERVLDTGSLINSYRKHKALVTWELKRVDGYHRIMRNANCRTNTGGTYQAHMMGNLLAATVASHTGTSGSTTATTLVTESITTSAGQYNGQLVVSAGRFGIITNTPAVTAATCTLTVDQWYDPNVVSGAAGSTPAAGVYVIVPGRVPAGYIALSTATLQDIGHTSLASELTTNGLARALGTFSVTTTPSGTGTTTSTFTYQLAKTFTYTGSGAVTVALGAVLNALTSGQELFENVPNANATVTANGDAISVTWSVTG